MAAFFLHSGNPGSGNRHQFNSVIRFQHLMAVSLRWLLLVAGIGTVAACSSSDDDDDRVSVFSENRPAQFIEPNPSPGVVGAFTGGGGSGIGGGNAQDNGGGGDDATDTDAGDVDADDTDQPADDNQTGDSDISDGTDTGAGDDEQSDMDNGDANGADTGNNGAPDTDAGADQDQGANDGLAPGTDDEISPVPSVTVSVEQPVASIDVAPFQFDQMFQVEQTDYTLSVPFLVAGLPISVNGGPVMTVPLVVGTTVIGIESLSDDQLFTLSVTRPGPESLQSPQFLKDGNARLNTAFGSQVDVDNDLMAVLGRPLESRLSVYRLISGVWELQQTLELAGQSVSVDSDRIAVGDIEADGRDIPGFGNGTVRILEEIDGSWTVVAEVSATTPDEADRFGQAVALTGDTLLVGAPGEDSGATGIGGDGTRNDALDAGAAYLFIRSPDGWAQQAYIKGVATAGGDRFGSSVAAHNSLYVVGAPGEASGSTGVDADPLDNSQVNSGAAYIFGLTATGASQLAYLKASNTGEGDEFGRSVDVSSTHVAVGAPREDSAIGDNGRSVQGDNSVADAGAVYVFTVAGFSWQQSALLKSTNPDDTDLFGQALSLDGAILAVAAPAEDGSQTVQLGGNVPDNATNGGGAVSIFQNVTVDEFAINEQWDELATLRGIVPDPADRFGADVALSAGSLAVGSPGESSNPRPTADPSDNSLAESGAVFLFR